MVVYPRQPHGIQEPKMMLDAMRRNLDWFDRWIKGTQPTKEGHYLFTPKWSRDVTTTATQRRRGHGAGLPVALTICFKPAWRENSEIRELDAAEQRTQIGWLRACED